MAVAMQTQLFPPSHVVSTLYCHPIERPPQSPQQLHLPPSICSALSLLSSANSINSSNYASVLDSCKSPDLGKQIHSHTFKTGFHNHDFVQTKLLQMYAKCGCLDYAEYLFDKMPLRNLYSWLAILNAKLDCEHYEEAFTLFEELLFEETGLDFFVFPVVFNICSGLSSIQPGRQLHGMVIKTQFISNIYVGNSLIDMYGKCGSLDDAKKVLTKMPETDCVSWNSVITACAANGMVYEALEFLDKMKISCNLRPNLVSWSAVIGGFAQNGYDKEAIELLCRMPLEGLEPNARTIASVLPACARLQNFSLAENFHGYIVKRGLMSNPFVVNGLVDVYRRCGHMDKAFKIFSRFSLKNGVSCNSMIVGYCESGDVFNAKKLFDQMETLGVERDLISWNSMISGYVDNFMFNEALNLFGELLHELLEPDSFTLGSILTVCADLPSIKLGKEIHGYAIAKGLQSDTFVGGALVEMYSKCQDMSSAQMAFNEVIDKDTPTWNVLISGYARSNQTQKVETLLHKMREEGFEPNTYTWNGILAGYVENGLLDLAMELFSKMQSENVKPDIYTVGIILPACSRLATLERGKQLHGHSIRCYYDSTVHIGAALGDMYSKCGSIKYAISSYNRILNHNLVCHNAMLTGYATHGLGEEGIALFRKILVAGFKPDHVTFLSVLSSCVHAGSLETGLEIFNSMGCYGVEPGLKHYTAMVDLLSRSGKLNEAYELIEMMPVEPDSVLWSAFLGGCVIHNRVELGEIAAERLIQLEPENSANYVMLANLYAYAKRWTDLARIRCVMEERGLQKSPGCSWIEEKGEIHAFVAGDRTHTRTEEIFDAVKSLTFHMKTGNLS